MLLLRRTRLRPADATRALSSSAPLGQSAPGRPQSVTFTPLKTKATGWGASKSTPQTSGNGGWGTSSGDGKGVRPTLFARSSAAPTGPEPSSSRTAFRRDGSQGGPRVGGYKKSWDSTDPSRRQDSWATPSRSAGGVGAGPGRETSGSTSRASRDNARVPAVAATRQTTPKPSSRRSSAPQDEEMDPETEARIERAREERRRREASQRAKPVERDVYLPFSLSVASLAKLVGRRLATVQRVIKQAGLPHNEAVHLLSAEDASLIVAEFRMNPIIDNERGFDIYPEPIPADNSHLPLRPPIVTIMGHVDHGKTTLLDTLRKASVAKGEAGGITQHIGAFSVALPPSSDSSDNQPRTICFLDTPGHAAFTAMRARGAQVTDIVILVVAADDGVMPQTKEVIGLVKESENVQLVVAINKVDKHGANVDRIKSDLASADVLLEDLGGEVPAVAVSGLTGKGLDDLMETVSTLAEVAELRAEATGRAEGVILESQVLQGRGIVATVLVTRGELSVGSIIVAGQTWAKVRTLTNDKGAAIKKCGPGTPVSVTGWKELPSAGEEVLETKDGESSAVKAVANRVREAQIQKDIAALDVINEARRVASAEHSAAAQKKKDIKAARSAAFLAGERMPASEWVVARSDMDRAAEDEGKTKELLLVVKGDVSGTVEAVISTLETIGNSEAKARIIRSGVGDVQPSDVEFAASAGAMVVGFSVKCGKPIMTQAARSGVDVYLEGVIYRLIEEVTNRVSALLPPIIETRTLGEGAVSQLFDIKMKNGKTIKVAGCRVNNGIFSKTEKIKVFRRGVEVFQGAISSLKYVKDDVNEVRKGSDCGLQLEGFEGFEPGDTLQCIKLVSKPRTL